jgi:tRNA(Ser,Leu) C12 N-acetylase TAN1
MHEWNVVVTVQPDGYNKAHNLLHRYGPVSKTDYFNILLMWVDDQKRFLDILLEEAQRDPQGIVSLARVMPVFECFDFFSPEQFEEYARQAVTSYMSSLLDKSFHVRMHRRGFKGKISGMEEEKFLDKYLLDELEKAGSRGRITFEDPDVIIDIETLGTRAGLSLWTREELQRYPLLHLD